MKYIWLSDDVRKEHIGMNNVFGPKRNILEHVYRKTLL